MRILIVEDNVFITSKILAEIADAYDMSLVTVISEPAMVHFILTEKWDITLIDHDLPGMSGTYILDHIDKEILGFVVAISALPMNNERLIQHGADVACSKIDPSFLSRINNLIKESLKCGTKPTSASSKKKTMS